MSFFSTNCCSPEAFLFLKIRKTTTKKKKGGRGNKKNEAPTTDLFRDTSSEMGSDEKDE
jgi:hypothetical protein